jgi:hypothetical protein
MRFYGNFKWERLKEFWEKLGEICRVLNEKNLRENNCGEF